MAQEYGVTGKEHDNPQEMSPLPREHSLMSDEVNEPGKEHLLPEEFGSSPDSGKRDAEKKARHRKHKKILSKMVYAVASVAMVVTLAQATAMEERQAEAYEEQKDYPVVEDELHGENYPIVEDNLLAEDMPDVENKLEEEDTSQNINGQVGVYLLFENKTGTKLLSEADITAIKEAMNYNTAFRRIHIVNENSLVYLDWEESTVAYEDIFLTDIFVPTLSRDANGNLIVEGGEIHEDMLPLGTRNSIGSMSWSGSSTPGDWGGTSGSYFDVRHKASIGVGAYGIPINEHMGATSFQTETADTLEGFTLTDAYVVRIYYVTDGKGSIYDSPEREDGSFTYGFTDFWFLPESLLDTTVLNLEDTVEE